jgi:chemotaxis protein methyltransferase CheR/type IV pilus assembly protein PilK
MPLAPLDEAQFELWQRLVEDKTGLWIPGNRKAFLQAQLSERVHQHRMTSYGEYFDGLRSGRMGDSEWAELVDRLTVHETRFFRDMDAMLLVADYCKTLLERSRESRNNLRSEAARHVLARRAAAPAMIQIWSVGCATGEEVYSLAMEMEELAEKEDYPFYYGVTGTDISYPSLRVAREGIYSEGRVRSLPEELKAKYFARTPEGNYAVVRKLRERVYFNQGNLGDLETAPEHAYNVIYCQNVLIYFKPERRLMILNEMMKRLVPGGLLVLAPGEVSNWSHPSARRYPHAACQAYLKVQ